MWYFIGRRSNAGVLWLSTSSRPRHLFRIRSKGFVNQINMFAEMWFHVGISRVVRSSSIFLRGLVVDAHSSPPLPFLSTPFSFFLPVFPTSAIPSLRLHLNLFPFSECSNLSRDTDEIRMGSSPEDFIGHGPAPAGVRSQDKKWGVAMVGGFGERVISYLRGNELVCWLLRWPPGVPGMYRRRRPQRRSPEPVSFIKSDKLFLTIALFLLFYNAVVWNGGPSLQASQTSDEWTRWPAFFVFFFTCSMHLSATCAPLNHVTYLVALLKLNKRAALIKIRPYVKCRRNISAFASFFFVLQDICSVN